MSKVTALYHIVFCTRRRMMTIPHTNAEDVYRFIWKDIDRLGCKLIRIGGIENHIHMLIDLNPKVALADAMMRIKSYSSNWMASDPRFRFFKGWGEGYYACSVSPSDKWEVIDYIKSQREHHHRKEINDELDELHRLAGLIFHEDDYV